MSVLPRRSPRDTSPVGGGDVSLIAAPAAPALPPAGRGELAFNEAGGPLVVVCGLHGGAGTSTLAYLLAHYAAAASSVPVLLCEAPAASGDQLALGAPESAVSLEALARAVAAGTRPRGDWWAQRENLRVLASTPTPSTASVGELPETLRAAAREHGVTVVDGGSVRHDSTQVLLSAATHVIWTITVQPAAGELARAVLASGLVPALAATQALAARSDGRSTPRRVVRDVRRVAEAHGAAQLLLLPYAEQAAARPVDVHAEPLRRPLSTLDRFLHRA